MADLPDYLQPHTVQVETLQGATSTGTVYDPAVKVACFADTTIRLVKDADGRQVVSSATLYTSDVRGLFTAGSRVTLPDGSTVQVLTAARHDDGGLGAWQHTEVMLG